MQGKIMNNKMFTTVKRVSFALALLQAASYAETFTTCGASGPIGPDQAACDTAYASTPLNGAVTVVGGIQQWTVPTTGTYRIHAIGAQGSAADATYQGGHGAEITGDFDLTAGTVLQIVVGQLGVGAGSGSNGGGGGGSFVVDMSDTPMIVAGGGGGTREDVLQNGCDASVSEYGIIGSGSSQTSTCAVKAGDLGLGGIVSDSSWGSGGAGFNGDGQADSGSGGDGGSSWANGMIGGEATSCGTLAHGGFGGGGSGNGCYGGGGGGGYSGGDGGRVAGGGGSYNLGANPAAAVTAAAGAGSVEITLVSGVAVPLSNSAKAALALMFASLSLVFLRRRRQSF